MLQQDVQPLTPSPHGRRSSPRCTLSARHTSGGDAPAEQCKSLIRRRFPLVWALSGTCTWNCKLCQRACAGVAQVGVGGAVPDVHVVPAVEAGVLGGVSGRDPARLQVHVGHLRAPARTLSRPCCAAACPHRAKMAWAPRQRLSNPGLPTCQAPWIRPVWPRMT